MPSEQEVSKLVSTSEKLYRTRLGKFFNAVYLLMLNVYLRGSDIAKCYLFLR